jgi:hypothetical protein
MKILIPQSTSHLTLTEDWNVEVDWRQRNLRMLKAFNLTGMKVTGQRGYYIEQEDGSYGYEQRNVRETVPNKLFMDNDGNFTPVSITFEAGTVFELSRYNSGTLYLNEDGNTVYINKAILSVDLKCIGSPMKKIKGLCLQLPVESLTNMDVEVSYAPESE